MRKFLFLLLSFFCVGSLFASSGSSKPLEGSYPIVLSHGLFGWGDETDGVISITGYWGGMDDYLRSEGVVVYAPAKSALNSNEFRGVELRDKINQFMAAGGYAKVHMIGHSQGGFDTRYAISNLGLAGKTASLTTLATPHRGGSPVADVIRDVVPEWLKPFANLVLGTLAPLVYGGGEYDALEALASLDSQGTAVFNANTPNASGVKYFSYGSYMTIPDLIQHPLMGILHPICGAGGLIYGQGFANDGLVAIQSARWGTWMGMPDWGLFSTGLDHMQIANILYSGNLYYDVERFFLDVAKNAKNSQ